MPKILFISSEAYPLIKTGGLADVAGSLPRALYKNKQDVRLLLPAYREVMEKVKSYKVIAQTDHYNQPIRILETTLPGTRIKTWLVDNALAFDRPGNPYLNPQGESWIDNAFRYALFSQAAVDIALNRIGLDWQPDVVHCNDWQSALVPALLSTYPTRPATVFTIHNMAYQGLFEAETFFGLGLPPQLWGLNGLEFHGLFSFMKGGLAFADRINTVSPSYAQEIQHNEFGYGLDGLLRFRQHRLSGIINGIDTEVWNPGTDQYLSQKYNRNTLHKKSINKTELQKALGLPVAENIPMLGMISRMVEQKGFDALLSAMKDLVKMPLQIVILGNGEAIYEKSLQALATKCPEIISVNIGYNEALSHQIEAASDCYLMPSTFEPCGLNQLYSLRYGTLPIARNVGGLADTVIDTHAETIENQTANGFIVEDNSAAALVQAVEKALTSYRDKSLWRQLRHNAMTPDRSWQASAEQYIQLYERAIVDNPQSRP